jgi:hypothetical protein
VFQPNIYGSFPYRSDRNVGSARRSIEPDTELLARATKRQGHVAAAELALLDLTHGSALETSSASSATADLKALSSAKVDAR